jgi:methylthioribose-1-phosphate isomerase
MKLEAISFKNDTLNIIDQTLLPKQLKIITLASLNKSIEAIKKLRVRGAPAIGIIAAYSIFLEVKLLTEKGNFSQKSFNIICEKVALSRPTAVNLFFAINKMKSVYSNFNKQTSNILLDELKKCAVSIHAEDKKSCEQIGYFGAKIFKEYNNVITHCNAGILATGGDGTALSILYKAFKINKKLHVYVDETRPLGQGARLTYFELSQNNVPCTLLPDNAAGSLFSQNLIDAVVVGADRIALNGDFANKIGTFPLAVLAKNFNIPFYVAAPDTTFDMNAENKRDIPIEMRSKEEVVSFWGIDNSDNYNVYNPAFDITPAEFVTAIITNLGVIEKPDKNKILNILQP